MIAKWFCIFENILNSSLLILDSRIAALEKKIINFFKYTFKYYKLFLNLLLLKSPYFFLSRGCS